MNQLAWQSDREFSVDGIKFFCAFDDFSLKTTRERLVILKSRDVLQNYVEVFSAAEPRNMLEFGIFQGGSPALFSLWFELEKFVGIDVCPPIKEFDDFCSTHAIGKRIRSYYGVSQTDERRINEIMRVEFGETPLDVVIDDASHLYGATRRAFEIAFPYLRPGGTYVIEDWGWAHWPGSRIFMGKTPLSMLIMELVMLCASRSDIISEVRIFPSFAFIKKAPHAPGLLEFKLDALYTKRGIELVGAEHANLDGVAKLLIRGFSDRMTNRLNRLRQRKTKR